MIYGMELATLLAMIAVVAVGVRVLPHRAHQVFASVPSRMAHLDGLRGILSLLVVLHHCVIFRIFAATGIYDSPNSNVENLAGDASVALFFIITGYLLWGRMLRTGGQADWPHFYRGRLRRLAPMYLTSIAVLVVIVLFETGFTLHVPLSDFLIQVLRWSAFALLPQSDINGLPDTHAILVVLWTLKYEWVFYIGMPLLALFARPVWSWVLYAAALITAVYLADVPLYGYFVAGALSAQLAHGKYDWDLPARAWSWIGLGALIIMVALFRHIYGLPQMLLMFLVFQGIVTGQGPWAFLKARSLVFLGIISYSTYLLHHMLIHLVVFQWLGAERYAKLDDVGFALVALVVGITSVALAAWAYLRIELWGIRQQA